MQIADYYPILVQISLAASIGAVVLVASHIFGQRGTDTAIKNTPYECGMLAEGSGHARFAVKFYVTAMLFILFDIEVVFLIPWVLVFREFMAASLPILLPVFFFLFVLFGLAFFPLVFLTTSFTLSIEAKKDGSDSELRLKNTSHIL